MCLRGRMRRLRRFAAVPANPWKSLMRWFVAAVSAAAAAVTCKPLISFNVAVLRRMCAEHPIPQYAPRRLMARSRAYLPRLTGEPDAVF